MTVLGNSSNPTFGHDSSVTWNQISPHTNNLVTPSNKIRVTKLWAHFGGTSGTVAGCKLCIWGTGGSLLYASQTFTAASGRQWQSVVPSTVVLIDAGTAIYVGWWAPVGSNLDWGLRSPGHYQGRQNIAAAGSMSGSTVDPVGVAGETGGYLEYVLAGGVGLASGGSFSKYAVKRYDSGSSTWKWHPLKRYNASNSTWEWLA